MFQKIKYFFAVTVVLAAAILFTGCGDAGTSGDSAGDKVDVNIGYFNNITHAQALLLKSEGSLEKSFGENVNVNWTAFNAGPAEVEALFAGGIDIGYIGPVPAITANVKSNSDVVILSGATQGGAVLLQREDAGITSVNDLVGKTVAIPQMGNTQHLSLLHLLTENGLKAGEGEGEVRVAAVANSDVSNVMSRGDIDAALVPEPWGATLLSNGAELVLDYDKIYLDGTYDVAVVVVRKEFLEQHKDLVDKFLEEHKKATDELNSNQEAAITKVNDEINAATGKSLSPEILKEAFTRIGISTDLNRESISGFAQISNQEGFIDKVPEEGTLYAE